MLNATLHYLLNSYGSPVAKYIQQNVYVDNVIMLCTIKQDKLCLMPTLIYAVEHQTVSILTRG